MTPALRVVLIGFLVTLLCALAVVAALVAGQAWKIEKPFPSPLWVIPGQIAALAVLALVAFVIWGRR